ncbi:MAG: prolyl oligopeptidase family serine peptidase [Bacteroidales bacterium]
MKLQSLALLLVLISVAANAQEDITKLYQEKVFSKNGYALPYRIMYPKNFNPKQKYPIIFVLHGSGERGSDNLKQLTHGASMFASDSVRDKFPAIIVFPQCEADGYWANVKKNQDDKGFTSFQFFPEEKSTKSMEQLIKLVKKLSHEKYVDRKRVYVGGLSMGGMGTFEIISREPKIFAAAFPICGGSDPKAVKKYSKKINIWIFHGEMDDIVSPEYSKAMYQAIQANGNNVKITLYPNTNHNSWDKAFKEPELLPWLFSNSK